MEWLPLLLAEAGEQAAPPPWANIFPLVVVGMVVMFVMAHGNSRQKKEQQELLSKVKKNDKVITSAGIIGIVVSVKENEDEALLRVDETSNTRIRVLKSSIVRVFSEEQQAAPTTAAKT